MKRLLSIALLLGSASAGFSLNAASWDATDAMGEAPYRTNNPQHHHALWLKGLGSAPTMAWIFDSGPGKFKYNPMGDISLTGDVKNKDDSMLTGTFEFLFSSAATGNGKKELNNGSYTTDSGPTSATRPRDIDIDTWSFWDTASGSFSGTGALAGLELEFTQRPDPSSNPNDWKGQFGVGANGKNGNLGFSSWFYWAVVGCDNGSNNGCDTLGLNLASTNVGDVNINLSPVPVPAAIWLFGSAILGLVGMRRRSKAS